MKPCAKSDVFSAAVLLCACSRGPGASHVLSRATVDFVERVHVPAQVSLKFISVGGAVRQLSFSASARLKTFYVRNAAGVTVELNCTFYSCAPELRSGFLQGESP